MSDENTRPVETSELDGVVQVTAHGTLADAYTSEVRQAVIAVLDSGAPRVAVDMSDVEYISSSGIGMLVSMQKKASAARQTLVLCGLNADLLELFALTRLDQVFTIAESLEAWKQAVE